MVTDLRTASAQELREEYASFDELLRREVVGELFRRAELQESPDCTLGVVSSMYADPLPGGFTRQIAHVVIDDGAPQDELRRLLWTRVALRRLVGE